MNGVSGRRKRGGRFAIGYLAAAAAAAIGLSVVFDGSKIDEHKPERNILNAQEIHQSNNEDRMNVFACYTARFEGRRNRVYDPNPNDERPEPTIGVGHYMDRGNSRETFARVLLDVDFDAVYNGTATLTNAQIDALFADDLRQYVRRARNLAPQFDNFPVSVQTALVDMAYRGDFGGSPRMRTLLNDGRIREAADEYINRKEYHDAERNGMRGIRTRMDSNRQRLLDYARELENLPRR